MSSHSPAIRSALNTIAVEKAGMSALEEALQNGLSEPFERAVAAIASMKGRVVVTGIGKSGHIGSKLAATFASTGTPAFFVHAAEANHGDLGMVSNNDVILALSWSGETAELKGIVSYSRRFKVPLIALTSGEHSTLGRESDVLLLLPKVAEACPHGVAPTTSTLMQLAIGDALALALLERRGFTASDFRVFHPGGSLGASLSHVKDVMHRGDELPMVKIGTPMPEAMRIHSHKHFGCVIVENEDGTLAGIITDGDLTRNVDRPMATLKVDDIMTRSPKTVSPDQLLGATLALLNEARIGAVIVVEENRPVGLVHFHDLLRAGVA
ncbi:KpsF/GutQ family sugar-phosphate isomerase [Bacillus subtilis]|uniref:KpsF/GutQ family sugar-phosphate isomerase n=1 Tax=Pseudochrobactrum asaccharolyticum TaxID=354351 RepID=UPI001F018D2E|nr:KpsF/GutQ family sugar-phosphate isomerase [Pseudochrobactrum asaccharolyticum]MCF7673413.1 KpsF/GutQ family sugar-phosphate isomerase [Bacillus subtilis]